MFKEVQFHLRVRNKLQENAIGVYNKHNNILKMCSVCFEGRRLMDNRK